MKRKKQLTVIFRIESRIDGTFKFEEEQVFDVEFDETEENIQKILDKEFIDWKNDIVEGSFEIIEEA